MVSIVATAMAQENELLPDSPEDDAPACVLIFNASDPSGAGGLSGDALAVASVGAHALPVVTGAYMRDTAEIFDHAAFDEEAVAEQARSVLEDISVQVIKVGFCGSPENLSAIAEASSDYADVPVVAYMPNLSWWNEDQIDAYLDAFKELVLPQTTVLVGHHNTLWRWLLPDWGSERAPNARDLARAASQMGTPYVLVTGIQGSDAFVGVSIGIVSCTSEKGGAMTVKQLVSQADTAMLYVSEEDGKSPSVAATVVTDVVRKLDEARVRVQHLEVNEPSLDDVFAEATGHRLEGAQGIERRAGCAHGVSWGRGFPGWVVSFPHDLAKSYRLAPLASVTSMTRTQRI